LTYLWNFLSISFAARQSFDWCGWADWQAWAMAMAEGAVGNASTAPTFALEVVLPDTVQLPPNTTLSAFAVRGAEEEDGLYIFVASLNADKIPDLPTLLLSLELPASLLPAALAGLQLHEFRIGASQLPSMLMLLVLCPLRPLSCLIIFARNADSKSSIFDVSLSELSRQNGSSPVPLLKWDDGEVYPMRDMVTSAGLAALKPNISAFEAMQTKSLLPQPFRGTAVAGAGGGVRLSVEVATPCALVVRLTRKQLNGDEPAFLPSLATDDEQGTVSAGNRASLNGSEWNRAPPPDPDVPPSPPAPLTPPSVRGYKNVLFIVVDDLRPEIGAYGHHYMKTPHLDKLASEGTVYTRAYVQYSFCAPSRNSFMCAYSCH
jgi:hypothetical protein